MNVHSGARQLKLSVTFDSHHSTKQCPGYAHIYCYLHSEEEKEGLGNRMGKRLCVKWSRGL